MPPMSSSPATWAASVRGVRKRFGDFVAVEDISFEVAPGTIFGLLGSNGAGKTTTIRMLMNIFKPDAGSISVFGEPMREAMKPRVGYLPEERGLYKKMRVDDMLRFFGRIKGRDDSFLNPQIERWLEHMGLFAWKRRRVEELSKGMSQKLQFIQTVVHQPDLLVLDEPFAGLDPVNRDVLRDAVLRLHEEGMTVLFSTHVMEQAEQLCESLVMLHQGRVRLSGTLDEVRATAGQQAAHANIRLAEGKDLQDLPGVAAVSRQGTDAELALAEDADPQALLHALLARGQVRRFEVKEPSLHEIFKRIAAQSPDAATEEVA